MWWHAPVIPVTGRLRQEEPTVKASLGSRQWKKENKPQKL